MTDTEKVRLKLGAVISATFTDDQIKAFLDMEGSVLLATAAALESWAAASASGAESEHIGDYSYSRRLVDNALKLAERYRKVEAETPAMTWAEFNLTGVEETD